MKIMFLDSQTVSIRHFAPIAAKLKEKGIAPLFIHVGSWGADPERPDREVINGVEVRDIRYYQTNYIYNVLREEMPYAVIIVTTCYFRDRATYLACRALGIKSVFLMHGIEELDYEVVLRVKKEQKGAMRQKRFERLKKYARYIIPNYLHAGIKLKWSYLFQPEPWRAMWELFIEPELRFQFPRPSEELVADIALVFAEKYGDFYKERYGYKDDNIRIIGMPFLNDIFKKANTSLPSGALPTMIRNNIPYVVYIEDAFVEAGVNMWTSDSREQFLKDLAAICQDTDIVIVFRLHPGNKDKDRLVDVLTKKNVAIVDLDYPLNDLLMHATCVVGHISTALLFAIYNRKCVVVPTWGPASVIQDRFSEHGLSELAESPAALIAAIKRRMENDNNGVLEERVYSQYANKFVGPVDGRCVDRIVQFVTE